MMIDMNDFEPSAGYESERFEHSGDAPRDLRWDDAVKVQPGAYTTRRHDDRRVLISSFETMLLAYADVRDFGSDHESWWDRNDHERQMGNWANLQVAELRAGRIPARARQAIVIIAPEFIETCRTGGRIDIRRLHAPEGKRWSMKSEVAA